MLCSKNVNERRCDHDEIWEKINAIAEDRDGFADDYALIQAQNFKVVFSYGMVFFLWGMSDRTPRFIDVTVPRGMNASIIKRDNANIRLHHVLKKYYEIGLTETQSPQGGMIRLFDRERCICDLIRDKDQMEMQLYTQAIKAYFKGKPNSRKLLKYGKVFGIEEKIKTYRAVLL